MTYFAASVLSEAMEFGNFTHSFTGVFTIDVLVAWALVGLWLLIREPLVALLPRRRQARAATLLRCGVPRARVRPSLVARWYVSAALGALTHVVWDAFTHFDRWGMRVFPVLGETIAGSPLYWYLQYGSGGACADRRGPVVGRCRHRWLCAGRGGAAGLAVVGLLGVHREAVGADPDTVLRGGRRARAGGAGVRRGRQGVASGPGARSWPGAEPSRRSLTAAAVTRNTVAVRTRRERGSAVRSSTRRPRARSAVRRQSLRVSR
jgi:hypothetical protein